MSRKSEPIALTTAAVLPLPATDIGAAVRVTNPTASLVLPADARLVVDFADVRGRRYIEQVKREILQLGSARSMRFVSGHRGCGKSTDMALLAEELLRVSQGVTADGIKPRFPVPFVLRFDAEPLIDSVSDVELEDLLVGLWREVAELNKKSAFEILAKLWKDELVSVLTTGLTKLPTAVLDGLQRLTGVLRAPGEEKQRLRLALASVTQTLIDGLNSAFETLRTDPTSAVVVLIDNLEKLSLRRREVVEHLYLERLGTLKQLDAHLVIAAPTFLLLDAKASVLTLTYGARTEFVPMVKVRESAARGAGDYQPGIDKVVEMLTRRLDFDALFDGGRSAAEQIARWSGGVLRDALFLAHQAVLTVDVPKVTDAGLERTFDDFVVARSRMLSETWGVHFRSIAANNRFPESCDGTTRFEMLRGAHVLEYRNGDPEPYYVVHPAVERCALFHSPPSTQ
jgi:hypothetical protein